MFAGVSEAAAAETSHRTLSAAALFVVWVGAACPGRCLRPPPRQLLPPPPARRQSAATGPTATSAAADPPPAAAEGTAARVRPSGTRRCRLLRPADMCPLPRRLRPCGKGEQKHPCFMLTSRSAVELRLFFCREHAMMFAPRVSRTRHPWHWSWHRPRRLTLTLTIPHLKSPAAMLDSDGPAACACAVSRSDACEAVDSSRGCMPAHAPGTAP